MEQSLKRVLTKDCTQYENKVVTVKGWVKKIRQLGNIGFLLLRDRSGVLQCVLEKEWTKIKIETESVVEVTGEIVPSDKTEQGMELIVSNINILSAAASLPFEINKKSVNIGLDQLLNERVLSMRHERINSIFKIKSLFVRGFSEYLISEGFTQIFTPKIVSQGTEGGANVFTLDYFERKAYLAQSPQFYKQLMVGSGFERVFEVGAVYRAEEHNSSRHLNEYISLDVEVGFIESVQDVMELEQNLLKFIFSFVKSEAYRELAYFQTDIPKIDHIPKMTLYEAQDILLNVYKVESPEGDLNTEGEKRIGHYVKEKFGSDFVFIIHYPKETRPMYSMPSEIEPTLTESYDLLYKGSEITSGGQRIHNQEMLIQSFEQKGLNPQDFQSYIDAFAYGFPPHGGFAIGLERIIYKFLNLGNVREASAFPRDRDRLIP